MRRVMVSEWRRLLRPGPVVISAVIVSAMAVLFAWATFALPAAFAGAGSGFGGRMGGGSRGGGGLVAIEDLLTARLAAPSGVVAALGRVVTICGAVVLVMFAQAIGNDYRQGTLKVWFIGEPRRHRAVFARLVALSVAAIGLVTLATAITTTLSFAFAQGAGVDTSAWRTGEGVAALGGGYAAALLAAVGWGLLGAMLGAVFRSGTLAVGVGLAYLMFIEPILGMGVLTVALGVNEPWLPQFTWASLIEGARPDDSTLRLLLVSLAYAGAFLAITMRTMATRDVTT